MPSPSHRSTGISVLRFYRKLPLQHVSSRQSSRLTPEQIPIRVGNEKDLELRISRRCIAFDASKCVLFFHSPFYLFFHEIGCNLNHLLKRCHSAHGLDKIYTTFLYIYCVKSIYIYLHSRFYFCNNFETAAHTLRKFRRIFQNSKFEIRRDKKKKNRKVKSCLRLALARPRANGSRLP